MAEMKFDPVSGEFRIEGPDELEAIDFNSNEMKLYVKVNKVDYREKFQNKRKALCDMVEDNDGFKRDEIHDLVLTANKATWQESSNS